MSFVTLLSSRQTWGKFRLFLWASVHALVSDTLKASETPFFNPALLAAGSRALDLGAFESANTVMPGSYRADVTRGDQWLGRKDIRVVKRAGEVVVCVDQAFLIWGGVDLQRLPKEAQQKLALRPECASISELVPAAATSFNADEQVLKLLIPQQYLVRTTHGRLETQAWDRGINAGSLAYNFNATRSDARPYASNSAYLGLHAGLNVQDWRLRHEGASLWQTTRGQHYQSYRSFVQRDVAAWRSQLSVGQLTSPGEIFDTVVYTGIQIASDDRMLPQSMRGYAPVVRGIARTSARVAVKQNGQLLYESLVAPGPFEIDDLQSAGYGGDLLVQVFEADGSDQEFLVPYAAVAQLLRPGNLRFGLAVGQTRLTDVSHQRGILQGTLQYGASNAVSVYGGSQLGERYRSMLLGAAVSTPLGAVSVDVSGSYTELPLQVYRGRSIRMTFDKHFADIGSHFTLATYQFSSKGFFNFSDATRSFDVTFDEALINHVLRPRSRVSLSVDQRMGRLGQLGFSGYVQRYWNSVERDTQYQLSYQMQHRDWSLGVVGGMYLGPDGELQQTAAITVSVPIGSRSARAPARVSVRAVQNSGGAIDMQTSLTASSGADRALSYGVTTTRDGARGTYGNSVNGQYTTASSSLNAAVSQGEHYKGAAIGASGLLVAHQHGLTASSSRSETIALVEAHGAEGAAVVGYPRLRVDRSGHAVVPHLRPYESNEVAIDPSGSASDVEMQHTSHKVVPKAGAVVQLTFPANAGSPYLARVILGGGGGRAPFGARGVGVDGKVVGMVGQGDQIYARPSRGTRRLTLKWGRSHKRQCWLDLRGEQAQATSGSVPEICQQ
ncbi:fimbria/pilus outer membrane usher protein [Pseudomonas fluorescens]|uniref:fimbria/pilus outer membrane usher protein n=1 Tax=Pseudomonas fluorescens TaxID=294 RepID=UPI00177C3821|nr:fimbria/pilus outer membrane usher protein [Pseudomonas fluorescens]